MESDVSAQSISHIRLTFPKRIFEVCNLMKRETEAEFLTEDAAGDFTKLIHISKPNEEHVSICLTVGNLTFEDNNLCFYVDKVKAKDENAIISVLEHSTADTVTTNFGPALALTSLPDGSNNVEENDEYVKENHKSGYTQGKSSSGLKRKRGRPRKSDLLINQEDPHTHTEGGVPGGSEDVDEGEAEDGVGRPTEEGELLTPSGRKIRKPARFRNEFTEIDQAIGLQEAITESEWSSGDENDVDDTDIQESDGSKEGKAKPERSRRKISNIHVVVEKRRGRPRKSKPKDTLPEDPNKPPHASKGKKRPNYKREANIECRICHNMYKDELSLISHIQKMHSEHELTPQYIAELKELAKVMCKICGKILGNKRNEMSSHMLRVHGTDDDFVSRCDECGMEFKRSFLLKEHIRRQHPKHDRVLCHLCPSSFKLKEYLTEHIKYTHNKQFKWECDICHKMTSSPKNLRRHKKLHEGLSFQCQICSKVFSEQGNLKRHVLYVHNSQEVTRRNCPHCDRDFTSKTNLLQHINLVHLKATAFYCDICKKYFGRKKQLIEHAAMVHPGVPILSTKVDDGDLNASLEDSTPLTSMTRDQQQAYAAALAGVDSSGRQSTIVVQGADGREHILMAHPGMEVADLQQQVADGGDGDQISQQVHNISIVGAEGGAADGLSDTHLSSLAQRALEVLQAGGGLDAVEFGTDQYLSIIGDDGREFNLQIVRKDPSDLQQEQQSLENIYVQASNVEPDLHLERQLEQVSVQQEEGGEPLETSTIHAHVGAVTPILQEGAHQGDVRREQEQMEISAEDTTEASGALSVP